MRRLGVGGALRDATTADCAFLLSQRLRPYGLGMPRRKKPLSPIPIRIPTRPPSGQARTQRARRRRGLLPPHVGQIPGLPGLLVSRANDRGLTASADHSTACATS